MASTRDEVQESAPVQALRKFSMKLPEAEEGSSCVNRAFRARGKAFAYLGMKPDHYRLMVKLSDSVARAEALQEKRPDAFNVGKHGWTTIRLPHSEMGPKGLLESWIEESYRALAPAALVDRIGARKRR